MILSLMKCKILFKCDIQKINILFKASSKVFSIRRKSVMKRAIFLYNPMSGDRGIGNKLDYIVGRFMESNVLIQPFKLLKWTNSELVEVLKNGSYEYIVAAGGDGTLNKLVNIMFENQINLPIGLVPAGTCNDFARSLNIPNDLKSCLDIILQHKIKEVDLGIINDDMYFIGTCAGGVFVNVSYNTSSELKRSFGPLAYYLKALSEVKNIKPFRIQMKTDTEEFEQDVLLFMILNGKNAGGFTNIIEEADISDGFMDIVLIKDCYHIDLAALFFKVLTNDFINDKNVVRIKTKTCHINADEEILLTVDGEKAGRLPISVRFLNKALRVLTK